MTATENNHPIGLVTALAQEYSVVQSVAANSHGRLMTVQSGMGRAAGFLAAEQLGRENPGLTGLVSIGFCGALEPGIATGTIILPKTIIAVDSESFEADADWINAVAKPLINLPIITGRTMYAAPEIVETAQGKRDLCTQTESCAVDMESAGIAHAARRFNLPFIAVRIVVDEVSDILPSATRNAVKVDGNIDMKGLLRGLASNPRDLPDLIKLGRKSSRAQKQLKAVCEALLPNFCQP